MRERALRLFPFIVLARTFGVSAKERLDNGSRGRERRGFLLHRRVALATGLFFCSVAPLLAQTPFFGPKSYATAAGKPQTITETISVGTDVACDGKAGFVLLVKNAGVASGVVTLNGVDVLRESDFPQVPAEVPIWLGATNTLAVQLKGGPSGSTLTLAIRRDIEIPIAPSSVYTLTSKSGMFTATATATADPGAVYVIEVANGDAAGHRVTSGSVTINGITVVTERELTKSASLLRRTIALQATNTIRTDLRGAAGDVVTVALRRRTDASVCNVGGLQVTFSTPASGALIDTAELIATGTTTGSRDVGVTVNGITAKIDLEHQGTSADPFRWSASLTPDLAGVVTLAAAATTGSGVQGTATRFVTFAPASGAPSLRAEPAEGLAPLAVTFRLAEEVAGAVLYEADLDGDGVYEVSSATRPQLATTYSTTGLRVATVRVTMPDGSRRTASAVANVQSFATLDALFTSTWQRFLGSLAAQDIDGAAAQIADGDPREKYRNALTLIFTRLPFYVSSVQSFRPMELGGDSAHYLLVRRHTDGHDFGYHIYFVHDAAGVWKIVQF
jgi:hypothetical protein